MRAELRAERARRTLDELVRRSVLLDELLTLVLARRCRDVDSGMRRARRIYEHRRRREIARAYIWACEDAGIHHDRIAWKNGAWGWGINFDTEPLTFRDGSIAARTEALRWALKVANHGPASYIAGPVGELP